jgi:hypothetical protein
MISSQRLYKIRPRKDHRGVDLISDALPFGRLWYAEPNAVSNAIGYAKHRSRSHRALIRVYDDAGNAPQNYPRSPLSCQNSPGDNTAHLRRKTIFESHIAVNT